MAFGSTGFVVGSMVGSALGNSARRRQAQANAQPRWVADGHGEVTVTDRRVDGGAEVPETAREREELLRSQLFVAMTRARDVLWLGSVAR
ncbi:hypothetical protein [Streptomyces sp. NBC_01431]|uniref:hypothetical protein n=1 Tax=Streptomyces sp. NBC_01431 TaxID=2903863 RepID=UPI002E31F12A|nr:hypothetical protein [Streptomyces sp. NBC_01431]